jgi:hypothetical protein
MKLLLLLLLLAFSFGDSIHRVARINTYSAEAALAYQNRKYLLAISTYEYLLDSLHLQDHHLQLNLAHAYFRSGAGDKARQHYESLSRHPHQVLRSVACQQLGTLHAQKNEWQEALDAYRQALVASPANQQARHNYELVKKYLLLHPQEMPPEKPSPPADPQPSPAPDAGGAGGQNPGSGGTAEKPDQNATTGPNQQPAGDRQKEEEPGSRRPGPAGREQEGTVGQEPGDQSGSLNAPDAPDAPTGPDARGGSEPVTEKDQSAQTIHERLRQINLSPEKAQMLLEALRQAEVQHIQQLPRQSSKAKDPMKPDW